LAIIKKKKLNKSKKKGKNFGAWGSGLFSLKISKKYHQKTKTVFLRNQNS